MGIWYHEQNACNGFGRHSITETCFANCFILWWWRNLCRWFCYMCVLESMLQVVSLHWESLVVKHWQHRPNLRTCPNIRKSTTTLVNILNRCMKHHVLWPWALLHLRVLLTKTKAKTNRFTRRHEGFLGCRQSGRLEVIQCALARLAGIFSSSSKWGQMHCYHFRNVEFPMSAGCWKPCRSQWHRLGQGIAFILESTADCLIFTSRS